MAHLRGVEAKTAFCLAGLSYWIGRTRPDIDLQPITHSSGNIAASRTIIAARALDWKADYLFWVDSDMTFQPTALSDLLARGSIVVGANYPVRGTPTRPTARANGNYVQTTEEKAKARDLEVVQRMGLGLCLMRADVFTRIAPPWFGNEAQPGGLEFGGEDDFLFDRIAEAGIPCFVDHAVSWGTGHVHEHVLTNAYAA